MKRKRKSKYRILFEGTGTEKRHWIDFQESTYDSGIDVSCGQGGQAIYDAFGLDVQNCRDLAAWLTATAERLEKTP